MRAGRQRGQALVLVALLSAVLVGIVGLALDTGQVAAEQSLLQAAADGAAMAAAYDAGQGTTQAAATQFAGAVVQSDGFASSGLTLAYLAAGGVPVPGPGTAGVATVQATMVENRATFFLGALGIRTVRVSALGRASTGTFPAAACAICTLPGTGTTYHQLSSSNVGISGAPLIVNSTSNANLKVDKSAFLTAPAILLGSLSQSVGAGATVNPTPTVGTTTDPYLGIAMPAIAGTAVDVSHSAGATALPPGVYHNITLSGGSLTLAGVYVVTGQISVSAGTLSATGSTIFLACSTYPATPCPPGGANGGRISTNGGVFSVTAPTSGCDAGLAIFADRKNTSPMSFVNTSINITGTIYAADQALTIGNTSALQTFNSQILVASLTVNSNTSVADAYTSAANLPNARCVALAP